MLAVKEAVKIKHDREIDITEFSSLTDTNAINKKITYEQFLNRLSKPKVTTQKGNAGGFIGGYVQSKRSKGNVKSRSIITLDIDEVPDGLDVWDTIEGVTNFAVAMYSTHNHTKDLPRYRVLIPLAADIKPEQYQEVAQYLIGIFQIDIDETSFQFERYMHYPTTSDPATYEFYYQDFPFFNASFLIEQRESIKAVQDGKKVDPRTKQNWIGAWTNIYSITDVLEKFLPDVYELFRGDRYSYIDGSTKGGLVVYDNTRVD